MFYEVSLDLELNLLKILRVYCDNKLEEENLLDLLFGKLRDKNDWCKFLWFLKIKLNLYEIRVMLVGRKIGNVIIKIGE